MDLRGHIRAQGCLSQSTIDKVLRFDPVDMIDRQKTTVLVTISFTDARPAETPLTIALGLRETREGIHHIAFCVMPPWKSVAGEMAKTFIIYPILLTCGLYVLISVILYPLRLLTRVLGRVAIRWTRAIILLVLRPGFWVTMVIWLILLRIFMLDTWRGITRRSHSPQQRNVSTHGEIPLARC